jgi:hypothetical protein
VIIVIGRLVGLHDPAGVLDLGVHAESRENTIKTVKIKISFFI